ncbi:MAG: M48 family metallopeptidase [Alphaproteobacteria bacterium]|nr:M48 family metallopeptidase [Alphaproteobacteria bacterium]
MKAFWPWVLGIAALWVAFGYFFNSAMIRAATGAKTVERRDAPELYNKLENLCIARGLKMPRLSIIEDRALNAFASGLDEGSFSVTVTRGLLENLDEAEVEAVLAHELTHILNRDVRLLIVTIVFTGMLSFLAQMLWRGLSQVSSSRSRERGKGSGGLLLIAALLAAAGYVLALVLRFALSRKREYLADAGAVELTKNPEAMIGALEKIAGHAQVADVPAEVRQMFIENPPSFFGLFDTHPRIADRINVLRELNRLPPPGESIIPEVG